MKKTRDYDGTFQTIKTRHKRLLIGIINECFHKHYPMDSVVELLPARSPLVSEGENGEAEIEDRESDCVLKIGADYYLIEVQSNDAENMAIRIAEYTFIFARDIAQGDQGHVRLKIPHYTGIYIKPTKETPRYTRITYAFPDGWEITCSERNVFLSDLSKEEIIEKKLYAYIPFYIARYEMELSTEKNYQKALEDLAFFRDKMVELHQTKELTGEELTDLGSFVNTIVVHITDGNDVEKEATSIMGGTVYETESERLRRVGREEGDELCLIRMVCRKLKKGKSIEQIADELEEEEARIQVLCDVARDFAPEYDERKILAAVMELVAVACAEEVG